MSTTPTQCKTDDVQRQARECKKTTNQLAQLSSGTKNSVLTTMATKIRKNQDRILEKNQIDLEQGKENNLSRALMDRLKLTPDRIEGMAQGIEQVISLPDPIGQESSWLRPNGLRIRKTISPLGLICMVYEARPNVTVEAATLCFKSGNACLLRGSRSAYHSNTILVNLLRESLVEHQVPVEAIAQVRDLSYESITALSQMRGTIDCMIPRGGQSLIQNVVSQASVPVIETGIGNCHLYIHKDAELKMAIELARNSKTQRPGVCNALETLLIHEKIAGKVLTQLYPLLLEDGCEVRGCPTSQEYIPDMKAACDEDWSTEFHDLILAIKVVESFDKAVEHIHQYSTGHTEAIVTSSLEASRKFQGSIDACTININASTRFTDGGEFGYGSEIGISTQKMHTRGPFGLNELTTTKYIVEGQGQTRH